MDNPDRAAPETVVIRNGHVLLSGDLLTRAGWQDGSVLSATLEPEGRVVLRLADSHTADESSGLDPHGLPVPPVWMLQAVVGSGDPEAFLASGRDAAGRFLAALADAGFEPRRFRRILDFGCGCGRVLRAMRELTGAELFGCDTQEAFIDWCARNTPIGTFIRNEPFAALPFPDGHFDLVYALSVVTHLNEEHQDRLLSEWQRVLRPGGALIVTFKGGTGEPYGEQPAEEHRAAVEANPGIYFHVSGYWKGVFPDYYETAYHTVDYVTNHWGRTFDVVKLYPVGSLGMPQDVAVMRRRA